MPQHEEHCLHSERRYGVRGDDIHAWMDEPSGLAGGSHRNFRHDLNSLPVAIQIFGSKYGAEMVENIFLDHLKADSEENRKKEAERNHVEEKVSIWTFPIPSFDLSVEGLRRYLESSVSSVPNSPRELLKDVKRSIRYHSYYEVDYNVDQTFKTSLGQIHHELVNHGKMLLNLRETAIVNFLDLRSEVPFEKLSEDSDEPIVSHEVVNPREYALKKVKELHSKSVSYWARKINRKYTKFCEISERNIQINSLRLVYVPIIKLCFKLIQTSYAMTIAQKTSGEILRIDGEIFREHCLCNTCGKLFFEGGTFETMGGFRCAKCGQTTCRKDGHWRKKYILFKEFVCPKCYEEGKNSGTPYFQFH